MSFTSISLLGNFFSCILHELKINQAKILTSMRASAYDSKQNNTEVFVILMQNSFSH